MITIKEYAANNGISYEAVRQSIKRYRDELDGHIVKIHRTQHLDDFAVAFLDEHRAQNPVVLYSEGTVRQIRELEAANKALDDTNRGLLQELRELERWRADNAQLIADANQTRRLLTAAEEEKKVLEGSVAAAEAQIAALSDEKSLADNMAREARENAQKAIQEATEAQGKLRAAHKRERLLKEYAAALDAWSALGWLKRMRTPKPVMPALSEDE